MKKVLKFVLWGLIVVACVGAFGVLATLISGGFNPEKIYINNLTINGTKEYAVISQNDEYYEGRIDFLPANANQLTLTAKVVTGNDVIASIPTVVAGQNFKINYAKTTIKDANGNDVEVTKGGEIEIKFVDASQSAYAVLKIIVDVRLTSNNLVVSSNGNLVGDNGSANENKGVLNSSVNVATSQKNSIRIEPTYNNFINSYKGGWSESSTGVNSIGDVNRMKKMLYFNSDEGKQIQSVKNLNLESGIDTLSGKRYYLFTYFSPATTIADPTKISVYLYRTYNLESLFSEDLAKSIVKALEDNVFSESALNYTAINSFVNNHMYANCSDEQKNTLLALMNTQNGLIDFNASNNYENRIKGLNAILNYVFAHFDINITVENITISEIVAPTTTRFSVLTEREYGVKDLNNVEGDDGNFGISLSAGEGISVDNEVLISNLRKIDIFVCEKMEENPSSSLVPYKDYFELASKEYYKILGNNSSLSIVKTTNENGDIVWKLKTQINTETTKKYYLVYRYRNNDVNTVTVKLYDSKYYYLDIARNKWQQYDANDKLVDVTDQNVISSLGTGTTYTYFPDERVWKDQSSGALTNVGTGLLLTALQKSFQEIYAKTEFVVDYISGNISFTGNKTQESFVLNKDREICRINENNDRVVVEGLNYQTKTYYVTGDNASVRLESDSETRPMEYTTIKWLISAKDNKLDDTHYKFQPVMKRNGSTWIPYTYYLKRADSGFSILDVDGTEMQFMEIGTDEFTLKALNAFNGEIKLWAVVIQTIDKNGTPYIESDEYGSSFYYHSVCYTTQTLSVSKYIENLYAFVESGEILDNITNVTDKSVDVINAETSKSIYLSSIKLTKDGSEIKVNEPSTNIKLSDVICYDESGNLIETTVDNADTIVIADAVSFANNEKIALNNYYETIRDVWDNSINISPQGDGIGNPGYTISLQSDYRAEEFYIIVTIKNGGGTGSQTFNLQILANGVGTNNKPFAYIPDGVTFAFRIAFTA